MKDVLFLDTNVVIDLIGDRRPFYDSIAKIATLADRGEVTLVISALTYSTAYYIQSQQEPSEKVKEKIRKVKILSTTVDLTDNIIDKGLASNFKDFEDALQYHCAVSMNCNFIITRNGKDFKKSAIPVMSADEYLKSLNK